MKFTQILVLLLILAVGVSFAGCVGNNDDKQPSGAEDTPSSADAKDDPILGVWDGYERGGNMQLVFYDNGTVSVNFRDQPALLKTWTLDGKTYRIYDADGYNSANVTFQNDNTIQYATSGAVLYSLSRNNAQAGNIIGTWEGYDRNGKMQLIFSDDGKVIVNYRDAPGLTKTWKQGRWVAKLKGYDLLGQVSQWQYYVSSQGRTEYRMNNMRRYVLLSLAYRFSLTPKKK